MGKFILAIKEISREIARCTRYVHLALFLSIWVALIPVMLVTPTDFPMPMGIRLLVSFFLAVPIYAVLGFVFWAIPALIVRAKKKKGKDWSGILAAANVFCVRYFLLTFVGVAILFSIGIKISRQTESEQQVAEVATFLNNSPVPIEKDQQVAEDVEDYATLFIEYKEKAEEGDAETQFQLAKLYDDGKGAQQDKKKALYWYKLAADQGLAKAQYNLGWMYGKGDGMPENKPEAAKYYKLAADQGVSEAQFNLALMLQRGNGVPQNKLEAAKYYKMAAEQGDHMAQHNYALMCSRGEIPSKGEKDAIDMLKKAAANGDEKAQFSLGLRYIRGQGVKQDPEEALKWFKLAAEKGNAQAQFNVGHILAYGVGGIPENKIEAVKWLALAAHQGNKEAKKILNQYGALEE